MMHLQQKIREVCRVLLAFALVLCCISIWGFAVDASGADRTTGVRPRKHARSSLKTVRTGCVCQLLWNVCVCSALTTTTALALSLLCHFCYCCNCYGRQFVVALDVLTFATTLLLSVGAIDLSTDSGAGSALLLGLLQSATMAFAFLAAPSLDQVLHAGVVLLALVTTIVLVKQKQLALERDLASFVGKY